MGRRRERDEGRSRGGGGWVASASGSSRIFFSLLFFGFCLRGFLESVEEFACAPVRLVTRICLFFKKWVANGQR
jgi:hypothetical protein